MAISEASHLQQQLGDGHGCCGAHLLTPRNQFDMNWKNTQRTKNRCNGSPSQVYGPSYIS